MPTHHDTCFSAHTPEELYALVMDVEKYPEFLPWCRAARITERNEQHFIAELMIHFSHMTERYTSKVQGLPDQPTPEIRVELVSGPFEYLTNHWKFEPKDGGCAIHFMVDFRFKSRILEALIGGLFSRAVEKMTEAFSARAKALYAK